MQPIEPKQKQVTETDRSPKHEVIAMAWETGYTIALPLVIFGLGGRWLDRALGTSPLFLLAGILLAIAATSVWMYRKLKKLM